MQRVCKLLAAVMVAVALPAAGCGGDREYAELVPQAEELAVRFTRMLTARNFHAAYRLTSRELRSEMDVDQMRAGFERIIPPDWGETEPVEIGKVLHDWSDRRLGDVIWVDMSIHGDVHSEAITFAVTYEDEQLRIRSLEFGRP